MTLTLDIDTSFEHLDQEDGWSGAGLVRGLRLGEPQAEGPLCVRPLFFGLEEETDRSETVAEYVTLHQALSEAFLEVSEVSEEGRVTELLFVNRGDVRVLAFDGEHLATAGLKQDRVLSAPILVERHATLRVPVACVEQGRWARRAPRRTGDEDFVAERTVRLAMKRSTFASMRAGAGIRADQADVWAGVGELCKLHKTDSRTRAMGDTYAAKKAGLARLLQAFPCEEGQVGILVIHGEKVVGLDYLSQPIQYREAHERLLRSYLLEALVSDSGPADGALAEGFLERVAVGVQGEAFDSVGLGSDVRYAGAGVLGHALVVDGRVVHASLFATDSDGDPHGGRRQGETVERDIAGCPVYPRGEDARQAHPRQGDAAGAGEAASVAARARRLAEYVRSLPGLELTTFDVPYHHMGALLTDAILQGFHVRYFTQVVPCVERVRREYPGARTTSAFAALLSASDPHVVLDWRGPTAVTRMRALTALLVEEGVETEDDLLAYLDRPGGKERVTAVKGIADKTFQYLRFLAGASDAVAVDLHLRRHLAAAGVATNGFDDAVCVYRRAAAILGVTAATLEFSLFRHSAAGGRRRP
jgi:hypothetical protein